MDSLDSRSGVTPADLLVASMAAQSFSIHLLAHIVVLEKDERWVKRLSDILLLNNNMLAVQNMLYKHRT